MEKKIVKAAAIYLLYALITVFWGIPVTWLFLASIDPHASAYIRIPPHPSLQNFIDVFTNYDTLRYLSNSLLVSTSTMALTTLLASMAGYSLSRSSFKWKDILLLSLLLLQIIPGSALMVPLYSLMKNLGLRNTYLGLILVYTAMQLPFLVWVMKGFFDTVPREYEEAAWLDGCGTLETLMRVLLPIAKPGLAVVSSMSFMGAWADVLMVLVLVDYDAYKTLPLGFYEAFTSFGGYLEVRYDDLAAMGIIYLVPVLVLFILNRKYLVKGVAAGVKG